MSEERQIDVGLWSAAEDTRAVEVSGQLASLGIIVHDLDLSRAKPMVILILPGKGGANFASTCLEIVEAYPDAPAVVLHTPASENAHPTVDHHVFELLPASLDLSKVADHIRSVLARWHRFEELKHQAITLQHLESTTAAEARTPSGKRPSSRCSNGASSTGPVSLPG